MGSHRSFGKDNREEKSRSFHYFRTTLITMTEEEVNFDLTAKKKKKKKKTPFDLDGADQVENEETPAEEEVPKKEKKKVEFEEENNDNVDDIDLESFGTKKKKKKKKADLDDLDNEEDKENDADDTNADPWKDSDRDYQYDELLQRVFGIMRDKNPEMVAGEKKKFVITSTMSYSKECLAL